MSAPFPPQPGMPPPMPAPPPPPMGMPAPQAEPADLSLETAPIDEAALSPDTPLRRQRPRPNPIELGSGVAEQIVERVKNFAQDCYDSRQIDQRYREQRYAKLMQWAEERNEPWEGATSVTLPDILTACLRTEDTLSNAALATRPMVNSRALEASNEAKQRKLDLLLDTQFFVEQPGERLLERMAANFSRDGTITNYVRWISEHRKIVQLHVFDPIPLGQVPERYFRRILDTRFKTDSLTKVDDEGWDWDVEDLDGNQLTVRFYTDADDHVEMEVRGDVQVFDGPAVTVLPYESVLHPYWCENLQPPSPSNPNGAEYVILIDRPTLDELRRLVQSDVYDLLTLKDVEETDPQSYMASRREQSLERQKDEMRGFIDAHPNPMTEARNLGRTLRYTCFDLWAKDGTGESMDVVWTVLPELNKLARARPLSEVMPGNPPRRPFAEGVLIPVQDRRIGIGLPELMEPLHDFKTQVFNTMGDACDMEIQPFGTYRQNSQTNPEQYEIFPGALLPVSAPGDIEFQTIQPTATAIAANEIAMADQMEEKLTSIGDLQLGRIPAGKSAALRTAGGVSQLLAQGEARPERILRRFFLCLRDTYSLMFQLDRHYLGQKKRFRTIGLSAPDEDPFVEINGREDLSGQYLFDFQANILNTSKAALQNSLSDLVTLLVNPLMIQLGISQPDGIYRILVEYARSLGQTSPERYMSQPSPDSRQPKLFAAEALSAILRGEMPAGIPGEPDPQAHLDEVQKLLAMEDEQGVKLLETLEPFHRQLLQAYLQSVQQRIQKQMLMQQQMAAAQALHQQRQQQSGQNPSQPSPKPGAGFVGPGDVMDESLPSSGTPQ